MTEYAGEPVVVIGHNWALHWASTDNLKAIVERTGIEIGTYLYAHPPREAPDTAAELGYPDLGPKHPLQMDKEERAKWEDRLKAAYCIQQKEVPDQTALVWRDDLITQHYEAIRLRAWTASLEAQLAEARAEVERLREALRVIDAKLCEVSGTRPKREPQAWCDAATFIEDTVTAALAQKGGGDADA